MLSVSDKEGLAEFAKELITLGYEIVSTGGTFRELSENAIPVTRVADVTGFPEILDGRVKTLHPKIHGGILARPDHDAELEANSIQRFHMVVVNLYPFERVVKEPDVTEEDMIENIDIGGPTLLRAAAKNHESIIVVTSPAQYNGIIEELRQNGAVSPEKRRELAVEAYLRTCTYDMAIVQELEKRMQGPYPRDLLLHYRKIADMRYGENPHQSSAFYSEPRMAVNCITNARQLHGKKLSFNNILDTNDALELVRDFEDPTATVVKHTNPCGVASAEDIDTAFESALAADSMAAFGGVIALNRPCTVGIAEEICKIFVEVLGAPSYEPGTLELLTKKKNIRILETGLLERLKANEVDLKKVTGGILVQDRDIISLDMDQVKVISERAPTAEELGSMEFAWRLIKHVKSNSIIFTKGRRTTGIGAGQMSRVDAVRIASFKAGENAEGSVMASDAFFPFRDGIDEAAKAGVTAVIQPGGSIRDKEVIEAIDEHGMAMVFTGIRAFKH